MHIRLVMIRVCRVGQHCMQQLLQGEAAATRDCNDCYDIFSKLSLVPTSHSLAYLGGRGKLQPVHAPQLVRLWGFEATVADLRAYATLFWVAKTLLTGYVIVSLQQKQSSAAVSLHCKSSQL